MHRPAPTLAIAALLLTACTGAGSADTGTATAVDAAANTPSGVAIRTVIEYSGASPEQLTVLSETAVEFADASLGCPKPGMGYAQVITPGHKVIIRAGNIDYDVRVSGNRGIVCDPRLPSKGTTR
jgi:hypothetical protein